MDTRTVYRVEAADGDLGPFCVDVGFGGFHSGDDFRAPWQEPRLRNRFARGELDGHFCGCATLDETRRWFGPFIDRLDAHGFELTVWEVPRRHVAFGRDQVMFRRDLAECVARLPITSLEE